MRNHFILILASLSAVCSAQVTLNQVDTFQGGTVMSWTGGSSPTNISTGGPTGAGDRYLQISSTNSNLATFNIAQWGGNYTSAGVNHIEADLRNTGSQTLSIRLVLMASSFERWSSTAVAILGPNSPWTHVSFDLIESNFVHTSGFDTFAAMMNGMDRIMFRHEPTITAGGTQVTGTLGIDNVAGYAKISSLFAESYDVTFGIPGSGGLSDLLTSNDSYLFVRQNPFRSRTDPAVQIEIAATAPPGDFSSLDFTIEAHTDAVTASDTTQKIELFKFATSEWVQVDSRAGSSTDQTINVNIGSNVSQYINPANRRILARYRLFDPGTLFTRSWGGFLDFVRWTLTR